MTPQEKARALRPLIEKAAVSLSDADALEAVDLFPAWAVGIDYAVDQRIRYEDKLYRVVQAHTSQEDWKPDSTPALYAEVEKPAEGDSPDSPIAYNGNMELFSGKYYSQDGVVYRCFRDTGIPVYNALRDLVDLYVEVVT